VGLSGVRIFCSFGEGLAYLTIGGDPIDSSYVLVIVGSEYLGNSEQTNDGKMISTGIYFARIVAGDYSQVIKMLYLK